MNIKGKKLSEFAPVVIPIVRGEEEIYFMARAVVDMSEFDAVCKRPEPPMIQHKGQSQAVPDSSDKKYLAQIEDYAKKRTCYMIIKSLSATPDLNWEKVVITNPDTYSSYAEELKSFGLLDMEIDRILQGVFEANGLNESKVEEAKKRFLATQKGQ